mgnify:CR=1 FL=1
MKKRLCKEEHYKRPTIQHMETNELERYLQDKNGGVFSIIVPKINMSAAKKTCGHVQSNVIA